MNVVNGLFTVLTGTTNTTFTSVNDTITNILTTTITGTNAFFYQYYGSRNKF